MHLFRCDFPSCLESAEIRHADPFCVKKCPCVFFFQQAGKQGFKHVHESPSNSLFAFHRHQHYIVHVFVGQTRTISLLYLILYAESAFTRNAAHWNGKCSICQLRKILERPLYSRSWQPCRCAQSSCCHVHGA